MRQSEFGEKLEYLRTRLSPNPSQTEMAAALGVSQPTFSRYLSGVTTPRWSDMPKIASVFGMSAEEFIAFKVPKDGEVAPTSNISDEAEESIVCKLTLTKSPISLKQAIERLERTYQMYFGTAA